MISLECFCGLWLTINVSGQYFRLKTVQKYDIRAKGAVVHLNKFGKKF